LLSAKSEDADKILGLTAGADDYVTKPFNPSELVARVKSQLRRYTTLGSMVEQKNCIEINGLSIHTENKTVKVDCILGKVLLRIFPFDSFGTVNN